jgi:hypothetical protein
MPSPQQCPTCGLFNLPDAERCECGYDFRSGIPPPGWRQPPTLTPQRLLWVIIASGVVPFLLVRWNLTASRGGTMPGFATSISGWVLGGSPVFGAASIGSARILAGWPLFFAIVGYLIIASGFILLYALGEACGYGNCI